MISMMKFKIITISYPLAPRSAIKKTGIKKAPGNHSGG
jgi:hypothetical protein